MDSQHSHRDIAPIANALWEAEGRPEGKAEEHWRRAEEHLKSNRQATDTGHDHKLLSGGTPATTPPAIRHFCVSTVNGVHEVVDAASVDESDPVSVHFVRADGSVRSFGRGVFLSYEELGDRSADQIHG